MSNEVVAQENNFQVFAGASAFEAAQRMATALSKSNLVPKEYQNNLPNCLIALEAACRIKASPLQVMQNLYIVHGKPSWSSQFIIAAINSSGKFSPLRFKLDGEGDKRTCIACAIEKDTGEILESPVVSIDIAKKEGWFNKTGSKWQTMPELMLRYRAATFFGRLYAPEILMGMKAVEEVEDIIDVTPEVTVADKLNEKYLGDVTEKTENVTSVEPQAEPVIQEIITKPSQEEKADEIPSWVTETPAENSPSVVGAGGVQGGASEMSPPPAPKAPKVSVPIVNNLPDWEGWVALLQERELPQLKTKRDVALFRKKYETQIGNLAKADNKLYFELEAALQKAAA